MTKYESSLVVEIIAKTYVTGGQLLVLASKGLEGTSEQLIKDLKLRSVKLRPISLENYRKFDNAGLSELAECLYKVIPVLDLNKITYVEDEYSYANDVLAYSSNNENNALIVIRNESDDETINNAVKAANALKLNVLLVSPEDDIFALADEVEHYLFK